MNTLVLRTTLGALSLCTAATMLTAAAAASSATTYPGCAKNGTVRSLEEGMTRAEAHRVLGDTGRRIRRDTVVMESSTPPGVEPFSVRRTVVVRGYTLCRGGKELRLRFAKRERDEVTKPLRLRSVRQVSVPRTAD